MAQVQAAYAISAKKSSEFFNLKVDQECGTNDDGNEEEPRDCRFDQYAIKLQDGIVIAERYNKWYEEKLPVFFVDSTIECYTVSKRPMHLHVNTITGALKYAPLGWLPPNSVSISFYKTGNSPKNKVDPAYAYLSWPSPQGRADAVSNVWSLCPLNEVNDDEPEDVQYQVFVDNSNFGPRGPSGTRREGCQAVSFAAINADPWSE